MADKSALERIGMMLLAATMFVVGAAGFAVHHQLTAESLRADMVEVAQLPGQLASIKSEAIGFVK